MANYSFWALGKSQVSVSGGGQLDGVSQGDGSHLVGLSITLNSNSWEQIDVRDRGSDTNFDDNDGNQRLNGGQSFDGVNYSNNTRIEAEYEFMLLDPSTGLTYRVISVNFNNSSPTYGTIEGLAFVGEFPPVGVALEVISAQEGPSGGTAVSQDDIAAPPCFTPGTKIRTPNGTRAVETLEVGDLVQTMHNGAQPLRWIGRCPVGPDKMAMSAAFVPVRICAGAFGQGHPRRDLLVSQQHRILIRSWQAEVILGERDVLAAAVHLLNGASVSLAMDVKETEYFHLQFDQHEVIYSEGLATESFNPGADALAAIPWESQEELSLLFPEVDFTQGTPMTAACRIAKRHEAQVLARDGVSLHFPLTSRQ